MDEYYWELTEYDGTATKIPPSSVEVVKKRWGNGDPIHTTLRSIPAKQIKSFRITAQRFTTQPLLEAAAQAFKEPVVVTSEIEGKKHEAIQARWVKQTVTMDKYQRYFAAIPAYKFLGEINGMAEIAFLVATHDVDLTRVDYCSEDEIAKVDK